MVPTGYQDAFAASVIPEYILGNPICKDADWKIESKFFSGSNTNETVTFSVYRDKNGDQYLDWLSTVPMSTVVVKGGPGANIYHYGSGQTEDTKLYSPLHKKNIPDISYVAFYYDEGWTEPKTGSLKIEKKILNALDQEVIDRPDTNFAITITEKAEDGFAEEHLINTGDPIILSNLMAGTYEIRESAIPGGYELIGYESGSEKVVEDIFEVKVEKNKTTIVTVFNKIVPDNPSEKGTLIIEKEVLDKNGNPVEYDPQEFKVIVEEYEMEPAFTVKTATDVPGEPLLISTSKSETISNLEPGWYMVRELTEDMEDHELVGYKIGEKLVEEPIYIEEGSTVTVTVMNRQKESIIHPEKGTLIIKKEVLNKDGNPVEYDPQEFEIVVEEYYMEPVAVTMSASTAVFGESLKISTSKAQTLSDLEPGWYIVRELTADMKNHNFIGYKIEDKLEKIPEKEVYVEEGSTVTITIVNQQKSSGSGGGGSGGGSSGGSGGSSGSSTTATTPSTVIEEQTPIIIEEQPVPEAPATSEEATVTLEDEEVPASPILPKTGEIPPVLFYGIGTVTAALGLTMKRNRK